MEADAMHPLRLEAHPDHELVEGLEPDQLVAAAALPLPRYAIGRRMGLFLWALRVFVFFISLGVVYAFVAGLK
jgi:hypothetical protein